MNPLDLLLDFLKSYDEGQVILQAGRYQWLIKTKVRPARVYLAEDNAEGLPVCQGETNMYGVALRPEGFVLYAHVNTNLAVLRWTAVAEHPHACGDPGVVREG